tara:strand:- start:476 stop:706 length:231 start_codon:yes stop_codon:yes gene_type:complete
MNKQWTYGELRPGMVIVYTNGVSWFVKGINHKGCKFLNLCQNSGISGPNEYDYLRDSVRLEPDLVKFIGYKPVLFL